MIAKIITLLQSSDFYGAGEFTEIAKGKYLIADNLKTFKRKIKRQWRSKKS